MLGAAAVAMWWDVTPRMQAEFDDWHSHEHMPERLALPGFLRGSRWNAVSGEPSYFVMYEVTSLATLTAGPYVERLNDPTPWSRKMMPHHRNMVRSLCEVRASFGRGVAQALATLRLKVPTDALSALPGRKGLTAAHLLESLPMAAMPQTTEQKIRGEDAEASWIALVGGYDIDAVAAACREIAPRAAAGMYRLSFCLT
ncbi:MAG TPA: hypothetical protein VFR66_16490 [Burkholderiales bacterium]|nr:hypothetical protein [Burkholderiales bacterium]